MDSINALTDGLKDGGMDYISCFPGLYNKEIFFKLGGEEIFMNEKIAYEKALAACNTGKRSVVTFDSFGLNIISDLYLNSIISGVSRGLVIILTEDIKISRSQYSQDYRSYLNINVGLCFEPSTIEEAYYVAYESFSISEELDIPVVIRLTKQFFDLKGEYNKLEIKKNNKSFAKNEEKYVVHSINDIQEKYNLKNKLALIDKFIEYYHYLKKCNFITSYKNKCIVFGNCQREINNYESYEILQISTYPAPKKIIEEFLFDSNNVIVLEQVNTYGFNIVKDIVGNNFVYVKPY